MSSSSELLCRMNRCSKLSSSLSVRTYLYLRVLSLHTLLPSNLVQLFNLFLFYVLTNTREIASLLNNPIEFESLSEQKQEQKCGSHAKNSYIQLDLVHDNLGAYRSNQEESEPQTRERT